MRDKRKIIFVIVSIILIVIANVYLYSKAQKEDALYKKTMTDCLVPICTEIEARGFEHINGKEHDILNGKIAYERKGEESDYGKISFAYDVGGKISKIEVKLDYDTENYSDDIFSEVYFVLSLVGIDLYEEQYIDALNILIEQPSLSGEISDEIKESKIYIEDKEYTLTLKRATGENKEKKIQFCLE